MAGNVSFDTMCCVSGGGDGLCGYNESRYVNWCMSTLVCSVCMGKVKGAASDLAN